MSFEEEVQTSPILLFNKYPFDVKCEDPSLAPYINISSPCIIPHTANRNNKKQFGKAKTQITERFANLLMRKGRNSGKKRLACKLLEIAFELIHLTTGENPMETLVKAIVNSGPREYSARIGRGGNMKRASVDVSSLKRVNMALAHLTQGIRTSAFRSMKRMPELIAEELINASRNSPNSYAVKKKDEIERAAKSNR